MNSLSSSDPVEAFLYEGCIRPPEFFGGRTYESQIFIPSMKLIYSPYVGIIESERPKNGKKEPRELKPIQIPPELMDKIQSAQNMNQAMAKLQREVKKVNDEANAIFDQLIESQPL